MGETEELAELFKAVADTTRLRLLRLLMAHQGALCVTAMAHSLGVTQSAVSQHLRILRQTGFVCGERCGCFVHYRVDRTNLKTCRELVIKALDPGLGS